MGVAGVVRSPDVKILLVKADPSQRQRWREAIERESSFLVVGEGSQMVEALSTAASAGIHPDVLLFNGDLAEVSDAKTWAMIRGLIPLPLRLVAITEGADPRKLELLLAAGVTCLQPPIFDPDVLRRLVRNPARGTVDHHPRLAERIREYLAGVETPTKLRFSGLWIDLDRGRVSRRGQRVALSPLEFRVLAYLARNRGRVVSTAELLESVWQTSLAAGGTADQVKSCIWRLRRTIEPDPSRPRYLRSVRGEGYSLVDPGLEPEQ
ncbi:MAG: winged helix-turn-helix domain-containing protein [Chloroflexota bacterium]